MKNSQFFHIDDPIIVDENSEQDLMSFEDVETKDESSQKVTKHVVVAKSIDSYNVQETNSVNHSTESRRSYDLRNKSPQY